MLEFYGNMSKLAEWNISYLIKFDTGVLEGTVTRVCTRYLRDAEWTGPGVLPSAYTSSTR